MTNKWTNKNKNIQIIIPDDVMESVPCTGPDDLFLDYAMQYKSLKKQLDAIPHSRMVHELRQHGTWTKNELKDKEANKRRLLSIAVDTLIEMAIK